MRTVPRTILLKAVKFKSGREKEFQAPRIEALVEEFLSRTKTVRERHHPPMSQPDGDEWHSFIHEVSPGPNGSIFFEYCTYRPDAVPLQMKLDLDGENVDLGAQPLVDPETGEVRELAHAAQVLAFGDIVLIESARGNGGLITLAKYLNRMFQAYVRGQRERPYPSLFLADVATGELRQAIQRGGGVAVMHANLVEPALLASSRLGGLLGHAGNGVGGTSVFRAEWKNRQGLDEDDVLELLEESRGDDSISGISLQLVNGEVIKGFNRYKVRKSVQVEDVGQKNADRHDVRKHMSEYLSELSELRHRERVIDGQGRVVLRPGGRAGQSE